MGELGELGVRYTRCGGLGALGGAATLGDRDCMLNPGALDVEEASVEVARHLHRALVVAFVVAWHAEGQERPRVVELALNVRASDAGIGEEHCLRVHD